MSHFLEELKRRNVFKVVAWEFEELDSNDLPRFVAIRKKYDAYRAEKRTKLLKIACGEIGFSSWKPKEENYKKVEST